MAQAQSIANGLSNAIVYTPIQNIVMMRDRAGVVGISGCEALDGAGVGICLKRIWKMDKIEMRVGAIMFDKRNGDPIVILNDLDRKRALPIWVGVAEARAINLAAKNIKTVRPLTHELLLSTIEQLGSTVKEITIDEMEGDAFIASIVLEDDTRGRTKLDARPSDAIALSMIAGAPVYVSSELVMEASVAIEEEGDPIDEEQFKEFVKTVKASDFRLPEGLKGDVSDDEINEDETAA